MTPTLFCYEYSVTNRKMQKVEIKFDKKIELKKILLADMESTIIRSSCIGELGQYAGVPAEAATLTANAMAGDKNFL